jgi:anti-sigma factor RsiW
MTCPEWELEIAGESERPELATHLAACEHCRAFAREIDEDRAALASLAPPAAALRDVRVRVMSQLQARRRRTAYLWWATAAACLAALFLGLQVRPRAPESLAIVIAAPKAPQIALARASRPHRTRARAALARSAPQPIVIKMLTDDPNVVIIWLVDKKGDSL